MSEICEKCNKPKEICTCGALEEIAREEQEVKISVEKRTYGKMMTLVEGIDQSSVDINEVASTLKSACAVGGTVKNGRIELQGNHRNDKRLMDALGKLGFRIKN